jgi:Fe-S-cluster-containing dehydrogenase component
MREKFKINRRGFLKTAGAVATAGTTGLLGLPKNVSADVGKLATLIDLTKCDGCADREVPACVSACKKIKEGKIPEVADPIPVPFPSHVKVEDWSKKKDVFDRLTPYNLIFVQQAQISVNGQKKTVSIPRRCMHCDNPACVTICPFGSNQKIKNGAVVNDQELCFGGAKCKAICPWQIPQRQSGVGLYMDLVPSVLGNGVMYKCDLCSDLLERGQPPACIEACPRQAMSIGPREEIFKKAENLTKRTGGYIYGKNENGGTSTIYVSEVPFDVLDAAIKKGPGKPGLKPVKRPMAGTDNAARAVLAAPALGLAAGAASAFRFISKRKDTIEKEK